MNEKIESKRLDYRFFREDDYPFMIELLGNDSVCQYLPRKVAYPNDIIKRVLDYYIDAHNRDEMQYIYLVLKKDTGRPIGYAGIQMVREFEKYEIFYAFIPGAWNQGFGTEASLRMRELAKEIGLKKVIALADIGNVGSQKVLERTGYDKVSQLPLWGLDLYFYEMSLEDENNDEK